MSSVRSLIDDLQSLIDEIMSMTVGCRGIQLGMHLVAGGFEYVCRYIVFFSKVCVCDLSDDVTCALKVCLMRNRLSGAKNLPPSFNDRNSSKPAVRSAESI